jgi:MFS family permease
MKRFYGWNMVWAFAVATTVAYGVLYYSFAVFVKPMELELGWNRAQTSLAFSLALIVAGLFAPFLGRVVDRRGARVVTSLGALIAAITVFLWSRVSSLEMLYLTWALLGLTMSATFYDPAFTVVAVWFRAGRSKALLIITLVGGLASTIFVPLSTFLLEKFGWRDSIAILASIQLLIAPMLWLIVRRHPHDLNLEPDGITRETQTVKPRLEPLEAIHFWRSSIFWSLALGFALARMAVAALAPHLVPLLRERGFSSVFAATVAGMVGVLQLGGRLIIAPMTSRITLTMLTAATFAIHGLGILLLTSSGEISVWGFVILYGSTNGAITIARAALTAELFPTRVYGTVSGAISLVVAFSTSLAPFLAGVLHQQTGNYQTTLWALVALLAISSLIILNARKKGAA